MEKQLRYLAVEGPIGVGKTVLAELLAKRLQARLVREVVEENPFLEKFYRDMRGYAFQTQLFFLLSRYRQLQEIFQAGLMMVGGSLVPEQAVVSDYLFEKDRIFATLNLTDHELTLYYRIYELVKRDIPRPDLVVYLQAQVDVLLARIRLRARPFEAEIDPDYLRSLANLYNSFFLHYEEAPVLIVNTDRLDFVARPDDFEELFKAIIEHRSGRKFYSPRSQR
jgi:deoxyadenosine/deoxycytidine kinase|uniref:Deoxynucleoside kinase n=1 Tax=candidate division WOR-3 bacterium TaxID=2052148 RepID=A0A7V3UZA7_UNCW3